MENNFMYSEWQHFKLVQLGIEANIGFARAHFVFEL